MWGIKSTSSSTITWRRILRDKGEEVKMERRLLLTTQRNSILALISKLELNPLDFDFLEVESNMVRGCVVTKMVHVKTGYYFTFDFSPKRNDERYIEYFPTTDGTKKTGYESQWPYLMTEVYDWLDTIKTEITTEDLWEYFLTGRKLFENESSYKLTNELFKHQEQEYISAELCKIKKQIIENYKLTGEAKRLTEERFDYLDESLKRLGHKDWIYTAIGVSFTIAMSLPPETAKTIWTILLNFISRFLGGGTYLPL